MMKLTKIIPARKVSVEFLWAYKNFIQCSKKYIDIRNELRGGRGGTMLKCDWCNHKFKKDEWFGLACPINSKQYGPSRNWALCHTCCDLIGAKDRKKLGNLK